MQRQSSTYIYKHFFGGDNSELPIELTLLIFAQFQFDHIPALALVNSAWHSLVNENVLWQARFRDRFPTQYDAVLSQSNVNWRQELQQAETNQTPLQKLEGFIEEKNKTGIVDKELLAANALKEVILSRIPPVVLDDFYFFYQQGNLGKLYAEIKENNLIPLPVDDTEEDYGYGRCNYN